MFPYKPISITSVHYALQHIQASFSQVSWPLSSASPPSPMLQLITPLPLPTMNYKACLPPFHAFPRCQGCRNIIQLTSRCHCCQQDDCCHCLRHPLLTVIVLQPPTQEHDISIYCYERPASSVTIMGILICLPGPNDALPHTHYQERNLHHHCSLQCSSSILRQVMDPHCHLITLGARTMVDDDTLLTLNERGSSIPR